MTFAMSEYLRLHCHIRVGYNASPNVSQTYQETYSQAPSRTFRSSSRRFAAQSGHSSSVEGVSSYHSQNPTLRTRHDPSRKIQGTKRQSPGPKPCRLEQSIYVSTFACSPLSRHARPTTPPTIGTSNGSFHLRSCRTLAAGQSVAASIMRRISDIVCGFNGPRRWMRQE